MTILPWKLSTKEPSGVRLIEDLGVKNELTGSCFGNVPADLTSQI